VLAYPDGNKGSWRKRAEALTLKEGSAGVKLCSSVDQTKMKKILDQMDNRHQEVFFIVIPSYCADGFVLFGTTGVYWLDDKSKPKKGYLSYLDLTKKPLTVSPTSKKILVGSTGDVSLCFGSEKTAKLFTKLLLCGK